VSRAEVLERTRDLYSRLQSGSLLASDIASSAEIAFDPQLEQTVETYYRSREEHRRAFESFIPNFDVFRGFDKRKQVVLDIGAHWGYSAITLRHAGCTSRIVSIEAMPQNMAPLRHLRTLDRKYDCVNVAASDTDGTLHFHTPVLNGVAIMALSSPGATLTDPFVYLVADLEEAYPPPSDRPSSVQLLVTDVPARRVDDLLAERGEIDRVVGVKMDVEGHESFALRGATRLFTESKPLLMVEGANRDPSVRSIMGDYGYFHAERRDRRLVAHPGRSHANDGYWVHPAQAPRYRRLGILE
jgi:FkbM family methyltransferase